MQQQGQGREGLDPLGRPQGRTGPEFGEDVKVPDEFDAERARQILEIIRRKLGENASPELERNISNGCSCSVRCCFLQ
jgi:hypothetical protein